MVECTKVLTACGIGRTGRLVLLAAVTALTVPFVFAAGTPDENATLRTLQWLPMARRRHVVVVLVSERFQTLNPMHAFQQSVHAVVNKADLSSLGGIITKAASDNDLFLHNYREVQAAMVQGKI